MEYNRWITIILRAIYFYLYIEYSLSELEFVILGNCDGQFLMNSFRYPTPEVGSHEHVANDCPCCGVDSSCDCPHTNTDSGDPDAGMICCACLKSGADRACDDCSCALHSECIGMPSEGAGDGSSGGGG